jgi:hypothetical protein
MDSSANSGSAVESASYVTTALLREPVKDAVKETLREEGVRIKQTDAEEASDSDGGSGRLTLPLVLALVTLGGLAYTARRKLQGDSGWSSGPGSDRLQESHHGESEGRSKVESTDEPGSSTVSDDF